VSKKYDQKMGHAADNDGIEEYDNPLPDWWIGLFIFTTLFGIGYAIEYHFISNRSQAQAYEAQLEEARERWPDAGRIAAVSTDPADIAAGEELFAANCASCHGAALEGGIGPNLADKVWIHDGTPEGIIHTITEGVGAKGMPAWGPILGPDKISKVAAFVVSHGGALAPGEASAEAPEVADEGTADDGDTTMASADPATDGAAPTLAPDQVTDDMIAQGEQVFQTNCAACHKPDLTGEVGPNLIDDEWIHGGQLEDILEVVNNGVPGKAMIAWGPVLGDEGVQQVSAFVYSKTAKE
jgi:cytochrome c oxidase cbb3-type subunit III